jgi:hypothetical protein
MKRLVTLAAAFLVCIAGTRAQLPVQRSCGSSDYLMQQMAQNPQLQQIRQNLENFTQQFAQDYEQQANKTTTIVYTIPVVVHVLYNTATQNISDAQILSQIATLNQDYQALNTDLSSTPSAFSGVTADIQISFCMAQRDPQGNATNGIVRKSTTKTSFNYTSDDAKFNSTQGDDAWPAASYLNIWVVPSLGGILGYAQFPGGPANTDGVVIPHMYFGNTGTASSPFDKGRTATHEVGHWMNLYHIWGDDGNACSGSDLVGDTPNQGDENYGCPSFPKTSCSNGPNGDMFMNYMDYTDDACMFMFTNGQKTRMHAVFAPGGPRASITTSLGCQSPVVVCNTPSSINSSNVTASGATLNWGSVSGASSYNVQWKLSSSATWTTISNIAGTTTNLSGLSASTAYNYRVQSNCGGGNTSAYSANYSFTTTAVTSCGTPTNIIKTMTSTSCSMTWDAVPGALAYKLQWKVSGASSWIVVNGITTNAYTFNSLTPNTTYKFQLQTNCASGSSPMTAIISFTTKALTCDPPINMAATPANTSAVLSWNAASGGVSYTLQWRKQGAAAWTSVNNLTTTSHTLNSLTVSTNYEWRLKTKCTPSSNQSAYGNVASFTTAGLCADVFEPNDTKATAKGITKNVDLFAMLSSATDEDWLKFSNTASATYIKVSIGNLPANYDIHLYKGNTLLGSSTNAGTANEQIIYNTSVVGTYILQVVGNAGAFSTSQCYSVKAEVSGSPFRQAEGTMINGEAPEGLVLYPNPAGSLVNIDYWSDSKGEAQVSITDGVGRSVKHVATPLEQGKNTFSLDISQLPTGFYLVRMRTAGKVTTTKLLIQR